MVFSVFVRSVPAVAGRMLRQLESTGLQSVRYRLVVKDRTIGGIGKE